MTEKIFEDACRLHEEISRLRLEREMLDGMVCDERGEVRFTLECGERRYVCKLHGFGALKILREVTNLIAERLSITQEQFNTL